MVILCEHYSKRSHHKLAVKLNLCSMLQLENVMEQFKFTL